MFAPDELIAALTDGLVRVCSREDLIAMKRAAGRMQDRLDLEQLAAG